MLTAKPHSLDTIDLTKIEEDVCFYLYLLLAFSGIKTRKTSGKQNHGVPKCAQFKKNIENEEKRI